MNIILSIIGLIVGYFIYSRWLEPIMDKMDSEKRGDIIEIEPSEDNRHEEK